MRSSSRALTASCRWGGGEADDLPQDKTNEEEVKQALDVLCYGLSVPVHKACVKLVSQYTEELVDLIVHDFPPK